MLNDSINPLAATPPPAHKAWRFKSARSAQTELNRLEVLLGLPQSPLGYNLTAANFKINELEAMVAARAKSAAPAVVMPAAEPVVEKFGRERFNASVRADAAAKPKSQSHPELRGRERFSADVRINATTQKFSGDQNSISAGLKGRERFKAALAKDFGSK